MAADSFQMTGRQQLVYASLEAHDPACARLYAVALRSRENETEEELYLSAHSMRLMVTDLPEAFDLPSLSSLPLLANRIVGVSEAWNKGGILSACRANGEWSGEIDGPLRTLLKAIEKFFEEKIAQKREITAQMFRRTDPSGLPLPEDLGNERVKRWMQIFRYLNDTAHRQPTSFEIFDERISELEQIILESLGRRPSVDLSAIDAILAEEEGADA